MQRGERLQAQRRRSTCQECGGTRICEHKRQRSRCEECGAVGFSCVRKQIRSQCKKCKADKDESMPPDAMSTQSLCTAHSRLMFFLAPQDAQQAHVVCNHEKPHEHPLVARLSHGHCQLCQHLSPPCFLRPGIHHRRKMLTQPSFSRFPAPRVPSSPACPPPDR